MTGSKHLDVVRQRRILVVDDHPDTAGMLAATLRVMNQEVRTALDGASAVEACAAFLPEVVFLDFLMPDMDGAQLAMQLKESRETPARIIAVTGYGPEALDVLRASGVVDEILTKPVGLDELAAVLLRIDQRDTGAQRAS